MSDFLNPKEFGLPGRTVIEKLSENTLALVIDRKSRIVMSDGKKILDKAKIIRKVFLEKNIVLKTSAPVCSKTIKFLNDNDITLI